MVGRNGDGRVFPDDEMTSRQRMLAAYRGEAVDRLPFWAKVTNPTWRTTQPEPIRRRSDRQLLDYIHADGIFGCRHGVRRVETRVDEERRMDGRIETRSTRTPDGDLVEKWSLDPYTGSWHPTEFPLKTREDIARFRWKYVDVQYQADDEAVAHGRAACEEIGQRGVTHCGWGTSPLMHLVEHVVGPINVHLMLSDYPDEIDELIELMHADCVRRAEAVATHTPADIVVSVENTSTTLISPGQFTRYCYRHLCDYGRAIEEAGKIHELHMCGHTRVLLGEIDIIPAGSIEAYTSPTVGNTRLVDGRTEAPSKTLIGGTNVNTWLMPVDRIEQYIVDELAACPDNRRTVLTTAGVAPPGCPAEKFRRIGEWIRHVPIRV